MKAVGATGMEGVMEIIPATHSGMTATEFSQEVSNWLATTRQKRFDRLYTELVYQPQLELLAYLRANGFKTFIVSGGGIAFMRPMTESVYGIAPEQVEVPASLPNSRAGTASRNLFVYRRSTSLTTRPASRWVSISTLANVRSWHLAIPTATCR